MPAVRFSHLIHGVTRENRTRTHESRRLIHRAISLNRNATAGLGQPNREFGFARRRPVPEVTCVGNVRHLGDNCRHRVRAFQGTNDPKARSRASAEMSQPVRTFYPMTRSPRRSAASRIHHIDGTPPPRLLLRTATFRVARCSRVQSRDAHQSPGSVIDRTGIALERFCQP